MAINTKCWKRRATCVGSTGTASIPCQVLPGIRQLRAIHEPIPLDLTHNSFWKVTSYVAHISCHGIHLSPAGFPTAVRKLTCRRVQDCNALTMNPRYLPPPNLIRRLSTRLFGVQPKNGAGNRAREATDGGRQLTVRLRAVLLISITESLSCVPTTTQCMHFSTLHSTTSSHPKGNSTLQCVSLRPFVTWKARRPSETTSPYSQLLVAHANPTSG